MVKSLAACAYCHGQYPGPDSALQGGRIQKDIYGAVAAANITPSKSGIGDWSTQDIVRAIRSSIDKDEEIISDEVHDGYEWMSDQDVLSITAYLRTLTPIKNEVERRSVGFISRNTTGLMEGHEEVSGYVPSIQPKFTLEHGRYLVEHVARCTRCHNSEGGMLSEEKYLFGGKVIAGENGEKIAPNISSSTLYGIGGWTEEQIVAYLRSGETPEARIIDIDYCPIRFYSRANTEDLYAIAVYLRSVPGS
ncbi:MAG: hypothetical protein R3A13_02930 [Bdellovibrionota bacterium]